MWFKYGYVQTYCFIINLFVFNHFIIRKENGHRLPTFARTGIQSAYSNVTWNQIPQKFSSVHCFSDAVKVNICQFQLQSWQNNTCIHTKSSELNNVSRYEMSTHCSFICHFPTIIVHFFPGLHPKRGGLPSCRQSPLQNLNCKSDDNPNWFMWFTLQQKSASEIA